MGFVKRVYEHPKFLPIFAFVSVVSFVLATVALAQTLAQDQRREDDRVAADLAGCVRGNVLRGQVRDIGEADQAMVQGVIDVVLPAGGSARIDQIRAQLAPILNEHAAAVAEVALTNCAKAVPGATAPTTTTVKEN